MVSGMHAGAPYSGYVFCADTSLSCIYVEYHNASYFYEGEHTGGNSGIGKNRRRRRFAFVFQVYNPPFRARTCNDGAVSCNSVLERLVSAHDAHKPCQYSKPSVLHAEGYEQRSGAYRICSARRLQKC